MAKTEDCGEAKALSLSQTVSAALIGALALSLAACAQATPSWGPDSPRNGAGEPVDRVFGTPLPGYPYSTAP